MKYEVKCENCYAYFGEGRAWCLMWDDKHGVCEHFILRKKDNKAYLPWMGDKSDVELVEVENGCLERPKD